MLLGAGLGGLVVVATALTLWLGIYAGATNTNELARDKATLVLALVYERVRDALDPVRSQTLGLADLIRTQKINPLRDRRFADLVAGALASTPQVTGIGFIGADMRVIRIARDSQKGLDIATYREEDPAVILDARESMGAPGLHWGHIVWIEAIRQPVINLRVPVRDGDRLIGMLFAGVSVASLSQVLATLEEEFNVTPFVLEGEDLVVAHPKLAAGFRGRDAGRPLPHINEIGDRLLAGIWDVDRTRDERRTRRILGSQGHLRQVDGQTYIYTYRRVERYGQEPWLVGSVMTETTLESALDRIGRAVGGGVLVLLVSLLGAWALGRWFTNRMRDIAGAAGSIRQLELGNAPRLPASRVRELDDTASAFNAMIDGLRWFETYVPRSLVRRLLRFGDQAVESVERDVTVMFTDLAGFTTLSERMGAAEVATFLNEHFALVDACIEAEDGTVDKHLGDGVMAFWGAPEDQPDHAVRAVRAALAIRAALTADNERRRAAGLKVARTRIGIQTGPVTVGNIGAASRVSYTIVGDSVNAASRLEDLGRTVEGAGDVVILVGDDTAVALGGLFTLRPMGKHKLRGRKGDTDVFEVMGPAG